MKKHNAILALSALGLLLTGCGEQPANPTTNTATTPTTGDTTVATGPLAFLDAGKIRIDIMNDLGATIKYGDKAVESLKVVDLVNVAFSLEGTVTAETINVIVVAEGKAATDGSSSSESVAVNPGIEAASFAEYLQSFTTDYLADYIGGKAYVAFSTGNNPTWTKGLNTSLDEKIQARIDQIKNLG
jgi:hypothetical protein